MKREFGKRIACLIACTLFLTIVLSFLYFWRYIDVSVILTIYLPIWIIGVIAALFGKIIFGNIVIIFAGVGIIAEYLVNLFRGPHPNMSGAFLNTIILLAGFIVGIVLQIWSTSKKSDIGNS